MGLFKSKRFWIAVYTILFIISINWAQNSGFSTTNWLTLIGSLLFGAALMFNLFNFIIEMDKRKIEHSKDITRKVLEKNIEVGYVVYDNDTISKTYMHWVCDNDWLQFTKKHLDKTGLCRTYNFAKEYDKIKVDEIEKILEQYRKHIEIKLKDANISLKISNKLDIAIDEYSQKYINHLIYYDVFKTYKTGHSGKKLASFPFNLKQTSYDSFCKLAWCDYNPQFGGSIVEGTIIAKGDRTSIEYLKNVIRQIEKDNYKKIVDDILIKLEILETQLKNNTALNQFNREREQLVKQVIKMGKPLKGKCDGCPD